MTTSKEERLRQHTTQASERYNETVRRRMNMLGREGVNQGEGERQRVRGMASKEERETTSERQVEAIAKGGERNIE